MFLDFRFSFLGFQNGFTNDSLIVISTSGWRSPWFSFLLLQCSPSWSCVVWLSLSLSPPLFALCMCFSYDSHAIKEGKKKFACHKSIFIIIVVVVVIIVSSALLIRTTFPCYLITDHHFQSSYPFSCAVVLYLLLNQRWSLIILVYIYNIKSLFILPWDPYYKFL